MTDKAPQPDVAAKTLDIGRKRVATTEKLIAKLEEKFEDEEDDSAAIAQVVDEAFETTVGFSLLGPSRRLLKAMIEGHEEPQDLISGAVEEDEDPTAPITRR